MAPSIPKTVAGRLVCVVVVIICPSELVVVGAGVEVESVLSVLSGFTVGVGVGLNGALFTVIIIDDESVPKESVTVNVTV